MTDCSPNPENEETEMLDPDAVPVVLNPEAVGDPNQTPRVYIPALAGRNRCICGTPGTGDFDGPLRDCPVHGER